VSTGLPGAVVEAIVGYGRPSELHIGLDAGTASD
jgi:hypothetical protein